jgi:hypothetical protein
MLGVLKSGVISYLFNFNISKDRGMGRKVILALLVFLSISAVIAGSLEAQSVTFKVTVINPSKEKTQTTEVKKYLPKEVTPKDIIDSSGLEIEYDTAKELYYVYREKVELAPTEVRSFDVEIKDVWIVPNDKLEQIAEQVDSIMTHFENTEYYTVGKEIADSIYQRLEEIRASQVNEAVSRQQHIGIYRNNLVTLKHIKEDLDRMEKILVTAGGPPAPEMLADADIKADAPSKTMTWIVVFSIIVFSGLLAGVLFFTWHRQARITKESISSAKKTAFSAYRKEEDSEGGQ